MKFHCQLARARGSSLQLRKATAVSPIEISFTHTIAGNSPDCALPTTPPDFRKFNRAGTRVLESIMNVHAAALAKRIVLMTNLGICRDVLDDLSQHPKRLSPKYFYDAIGSELFEQITGCRNITDAHE